MAASDKNAVKLQQTIGYTFRDVESLKAAMTHSSLGGRNNERLEFLGDRVLNLIVAEALFRRFEGEQEGDLAKRHAALVQGSTLAPIADRVGLGEALLLSDAERVAGGAHNENILADCLEALLGALFLEAGLDECRRVVLELWGDAVDIMKNPPRDPKTSLQEWAQARGLPLPDYRLAEREGPDHAPVFTIEATVRGFPPARCSGPSRRKAEKEAATALLARLEGTVHDG